ncbi:competence type IV pilus minor pilin ComGF [Planococcus sp. N028]|uniref:Competence type IV pilus minor pilin ComGF n=2 Tax=Planococcus shixiaomingii TaxID=3058393 RepID=A0ABT8MYH8_9BACL|nr:competence type IV pilus minor pilin ComGF [Planococcus sp. N028]MDN7240484.1 competence type IV pilus minor pilin ComGF [Planococcus sp. N028]
MLEVKMNERGFAFLNSLMDLMVLMLLLPLIVLFFSFVMQFSQALNPKTLEWQLFTEELRVYLHEIDSIEEINNGGGVRIIQKGEEYDIESYLQIIRKQKFRQGHEPMLTGVESCTFKIDGAKLKIRVKFSGGPTEEAEYVLTPP